MENEKKRINKLMAERGICTRRQADEYISAGIVFVNGKKAVLGNQVNIDDKIEIRDEAKVYDTEHQYVAYYKPNGVVTHSPMGKQKGVSQVSGFPDLYPVGRLDKDSEGLIVLTNDGRITERLLHPRFAHEKEYLVEFSGRFPKNGEEKLLAGILDEGDLLQAKEIEVLDRKHVTLVLTEGKKHQVRRMLGHLGLEVEVLKRTRIMGLNIGALRPGQSRVLKGKALKAFLADLNLK